MIASMDPGKKNPSSWHSNLQNLRVERFESIFSELDRIYNVDVPNLVPHLKRAPAFEW